MTGKDPASPPGSALPGFLTLCLVLQAPTLASDLGSVPDIAVEGHQDGGVRLVCRSSGWFPNPQAEWRDQQGQRLPSASESTSQEAGGLFQTEIAILLTEESSRKVSCRVWNARCDQERESAVSIEELFFLRFKPWMVAMGVTLAIVFVLIPLASYCSWRQHRAKGKLQAALDKLKKEHGKLQAELGWRCAQLCAVDVTLDPDTAHPQLVLSEDGKSVRLGDTRQDLPDTPERFDHAVCVLGAERFAGGRGYWEVEVGKKLRWTLGVCRESVSRKVEVTHSPGDGYWVVWLKDGGYKAFTSTPTPLSVSAWPSRVGIFLDYEAGEVSFYNVTDRSLLFTFTDSFSGMLRPYFYLGLRPEGTNAEPLTICPVLAQAGGDPNTASGRSEERVSQQGEPSDSPGRAEAEGREEEIPLCSIEAGNTPNGPC